MKNFLLLIFILLGIQAQCQSIAPEFQPYFSAVVVKNVSTSVKWYQSVFDLHVKTEINDPNQSYKVTILESLNYLLEILELKGSLTRKEALKNKPEETKLQGHFKIGFKISSADKWLEHLKNLNVTVSRVWTDSKTGKKNFLIEDPDGNIVQFFE